MAGFLIAELTTRAKVTQRTVQYYVRFGLLARPTGTGVGATYAPDTLARLWAIAKLKAQKAQLSYIKERLARMPADELAVFGADPAAPPPAPPPPAPPPPPPAPDAPTRLGPYRPTLAAPHDRWDRVVLCPGVELFVRSDVDAEALRVAREIEAFYLGAKDEPAPRG